MSKNVSKCLKMSRKFSKCQFISFNVSKCLEMFQKLSPNVDKCLEYQQISQKINLIAQKLSGGLKISTHFNKCHLTNVSICLKMSIYLSNV